MANVKVYFEKQGSGRLCGVHCLNSLLQCPVFTQADLNKYGSDLDKEEAALLAADPSKAPPPRTMTISSLSNQPKSDNVDSTGYFSLSVLERALKSKYGYTVENASRREILNEIKNEGFQNHDGFVIHLRDHWFTARNVNGTWFFLDSLKDGPEIVTEKDLWGTLQGLIQSGNHVFVIRGGRLPTTPPNVRYLAPNQFYLPSAEIHKQSASGGSVSFAVSTEKKTTDWGTLGQGQSLSAKPTDEDNSLQAAIAASLMQSVPSEPEPDAGPSVVTVMVRCVAGRKVRRFSIESPLSLLWQWIWQWMPSGRVLQSPGIKISSDQLEPEIGTVMNGGDQVMFNLV